MAVFIDHPFWSTFKKTMTIEKGCWRRRRLRRHRVDSPRPFPISRLPSCEVIRFIVTRGAFDCPKENYGPPKQVQAAHDSTTRQENMWMHLFLPTSRRFQLRIPHLFDCGHLHSFLQSFSLWIRRAACHVPNCKYKYAQ